MPKHINGGNHAMQGLPDSSKTCCLNGQMGTGYSLGAKEKLFHEAEDHFFFIFVVRRKFETETPTPVNSVRDVITKMGQFLK
ncbi:hypothetical protein ACI01nite_21080 [Acetobacter cibinongensis]|uniref:Uncharacterized protein n=1 Tax=Acetobacter cibinongensis TaxID=146475 RepID=A0A0D6N0M9_9PROT|nr:hypothetical protein Abci_002_005 [Acetobacter cibinongensis]GBQ19046.1 hypothetical protein AA0482_2441 [Acetobacter cibinongensis NRIC 0482]GEL59506.1 hypothetical protein ACI01nite_21080 [Acetobacter cibinongensis]